MLRRCCLLPFLAGLLTLSACHRAQQYQLPAERPASKSAEKDDELRRWTWTEQRPGRDLPIVFVADTSPEWPALKAYWDGMPIPPGMPTAHLGLPPLGAVVALVVTEPHAAFKIKVPRGLPDPTPNIPAANPPTVGKWRLGKTLFFKRLLKAGNAAYACADCHDPRHGFAEDKLHPEGGKYNTLSLLNVAYNRRQFWDGRVETLEETLVRGFEDEGTDGDMGRAKALEQHSWGGFARALGADKDLSAEFKLVFGVDRPTQNSAAQALATYLRTLLSGDSLYDQADALRRAHNAPALTAEHFGAVLKDEAAAAVLRDPTDRKPMTRAELPALLHKGHEVFHGKAGCAACHRGPLFTDHDYHNIGYEGEGEGTPAVGVETGRSVHVPIGLKEARLIGAFRTPSLRNLTRTAPYFHDGSQATLALVVETYDRGVLDSPYLAAPLKDADFPLRPRRLKLTEPEREALVIYLRSLQGGPVDAVLLPQSN